LEFVAGLPVEVLSELSEQVLLFSLMSSGAAGKILMGIGLNEFESCICASDMIMLKTTSSELAAGVLVSADSVFTVASFSLTAE
jgi:hypothetical protein